MSPTVVIMNSGFFKDGTTRMAGIEATKAVLADLHSPTLYILGGPTDIAYANGMDDFARIAHVPVAVANINTGHGGTYWEPNGGAAAQVVVHWLDWRLRGDKEAAGTFVGAKCGLCADHAWTFETKRLRHAALATLAAACDCGAYRVRKNRTKPKGNRDENSVTDDGRPVGRGRDATGARAGARARHAGQPRDGGQESRGPGLRRNFPAHLRRTRQSLAAAALRIAAAGLTYRSRPCDLVRPALQSVRQPLLHRHEDPFRVGADDERRHHRHRHVVRLRHRAGNRRGPDQARPRAAQHQIRADQPCARRSRSRRGAAAEPLRRQGRDGRGRLGLRRCSAPPLPPGGVPKRDISVGPEGSAHQARRHHRQHRRNARPHTGHAVVPLPSQGRSPDADGGLLGRHRFQLPSARRELRHLPRQRETRWRKPRARPARPS